MKRKIGVPGTRRGKKSGAVREEVLQLPTVNVTKIERVLHVTVPEQINLEKLAEYYRLDGMKIGIATLLQLPEQFRASVVNGSIPQQVDTIKFIGSFRRAMSAGFEQVLDKIDAMKAEIEKITGFEQQPVSANDLIPDQFVRIVRIPDSEGGGFGAEFDFDIRGKGPTIIDALKDLVAMMETGVFNDP